MNDRRGVEIQRGDLVCYPVRRGRKLEMHDAVVTEVLDGALVVELPNGHETKLYCLDRVTLLRSVHTATNPPEDQGEDPDRGWTWRKIFWGKG